MLNPPWKSNPVAATLDKFFIENLGKYRKYDGRSVQDLMRALRNKVSPLDNRFITDTHKRTTSRNIIIRICPTMSSGRLAPCQMVSFLILLDGSLDCFYTFTQSSRLHHYAMSQCSAHISNSPNNCTQFCIPWVHWISIVLYLYRSHTLF